MWVYEVKDKSDSWQGVDSRGKSVILKGMGRATAWFSRHSKGRDSLRHAIRMVPKSHVKSSTVLHQMSISPVWPTGARNTGTNMTSICSLLYTVPSLQLILGTSQVWFQSPSQAVHHKKSQEPGNLVHYRGVFSFSSSLIILCLTLVAITGIV